MKQAIKIPPVGESITEATISAWLKKDGEYANIGEPVLSVDTDKASVEVVAEVAGTISTKAKAGDVVKIGAVVGDIDTDGKASAQAAPSAAPEKAAKLAPAEAPKAANGNGSSNGNGHAKPAGLPPSMSPAVRRVVAEYNVDPASVQGTGPQGRITKADAMTAATSGSSTPSAGTVTPLRVPNDTVQQTQRGSRRVPMTTIRKRIAERLVSAQHNAAILTTFNEVDMSQVLALREKYKEKFKEKYGISLGFMGFFTKAVVDALKAYPQVNAFIDGTDIVYNDFYNIGVAVSTEKGLIVPVVHDADQLTLAEIETVIRNYSLKARDGKISINDLSGGTFTISNGGVFGSLMSTPILNPPQSAILGMHAIQERPIVVNGKIEIRPMMYLALSYDHRMIDGREAVTFLVKVKEAISDPNRLLLEI